MKLTRLFLPSFFFLSLLVSLAAPLAIVPSKAEALSGSEFKAGRIIDDGVFYSANSMSQGQIQEFLNAKVPSCDTNGEKMYNSTQTRAQWAEANGQPLPPYTCLKSYTQLTTTKSPESGLCNGHTAGTKSSAQIIYEVAQSCGVSPKVLIVLLQKEQSLVTDDWPWPIQYRSATGYGCPDTAPCDEQYYGFFNQVYMAARVYKYYRAYPHEFNHIAGINNNILYNPNSACGSSSVFIENQATAGLYNYTPYQPNAAALNNLYGTGDACSAYGNRNFWRLFRDWFGSTEFPQPIGATLNHQSSTGKIFLVSDNIRYHIPSWAVMVSFGLDKYGAIPTTDTTINSYTDGGTLSTLVSNGGKIHLVNRGTRHHIPSSTVCTNWNFSCFDTNIVKEVGNEFFTAHLLSGGAINSTARTSAGAYYELLSGNKHPFANEKSFTNAGYTKGSALLADINNLSQTLGSLRISTPGVIKFSPKSTIYYFNGTEYIAVPGPDVYNAWKLSSAPQISPPTSAYNSTETAPSSKSLTYWAQDGSSKKYIVDGGRKILPTSTQLNLWPTATYQTGTDALLSALPTVSLGQFIKNGINFYKLSASTKDYIPSLGDYTGLGGTSSNTTGMGVAAGQIANGHHALASASLVKIDNGSTIYTVNNGKLLTVPDMGVLKSYNLTSMVRNYSAAFRDAYGVQGTLRYGLLANGSAVVPHQNQLLELSDAQVKDYGLKKTGFLSIDNRLTKDSTKKPFTKFMRNADNGKIYYASGGALHYVTSQESFEAYGGTTTPMTHVNSVIIDLFFIAQPI